MTVDLSPGAAIYTTITIGGATAVQVFRPWDPNKTPVAIPPGALDALETARLRIYWQWQQDPSFLSLAQIIGTTLQAVVSEHFEIDQFRWLSTGSGNTLDEWGAVVDLSRNGLPDLVYEPAIRARGASLVGDAGIDAVMKPIKQLLGEDSVTYAPSYPRAFCWIVTAHLAGPLLDLVVSLVTDSVVGVGIGAKIILAPPDSPGWGWTTPQIWSSSWSSAYGAVDASVVSPWSWVIPIS